MAEQPEPEKLDKPPIEGRYHYLADFSRQDSPNLRKMYRDSYSYHANSHQRSSSSHRRSPYRSSHKRNTALNRQSPSCSTFNPRREVTQEQFSPYDDRADREEQRLSRQLMEENAQLRAQLLEANKLAEALKGDLSRRQKQVIQLRQASQADLHYFQKVVAEMTGEIQIVLTKNKILENELVVAKARLQQELRRQEEFARYEEERKRIELRIREEHSRDQKRGIGQVATANQPPSRRSVGKLLSRPTVHQDHKQSLGTSKIKIEEDLEGTFTQTNSVSCENKATENLNQTADKAVEKQAKKSEELIQSIRSMHFKITGAQASSLRELWKWLKTLGHSHSLLKRWKNRAETGVFLNLQRLRQLIKEACSYIQ